MTENVYSDYLRVILDSDFSLTIFTSLHVLIIVLGLILIIVIVKFLSSNFSLLTTFEINEAEFGIGNQKIKLKPNDIDRQIAYKIWVELSTRKIGLDIDLNDDVISEIYDSWYNFFSVTRELIKEVPVSRFRRKETEKIICLSIDILNLGIRPHLTKWQARFRRWYEIQMNKDENAEMHPQDIQNNFSDFKELREDLLLVNNRLIEYRNTMYKLISI